MNEVAPVDVARLEGLEAQATSGPWFVDELERIYVGNRADGRSSGLWEIVYATGDELGDLTPRAQERERTDAEFIAAMRTAAPSLLAAYRAVERVRTALDAAPPRRGGGLRSDEAIAALHAMPVLSANDVRAALGSETE